MWLFIQAKSYETFHWIKKGDFKIICTVLKICTKIKHWSFLKTKNKNQKTNVSMAPSRGRSSAPPWPAASAAFGNFPATVEAAASTLLRAAHLWSLPQPYLCSVCHPRCSRTCRCTCMTVGCSGRWHRCGSGQSPPHTHLHLAGVEEDTWDPWLVPFKWVLKVCSPTAKYSLQDRASIPHIPDFRNADCHFRNSERNHHYHHCLRNT